MSPQLRADSAPPLRAALRPRSARRTHGTSPRLSVGDYSGEALASRLTPLRTLPTHPPQRSGCACCRSSCSCCCSCCCWCSCCGCCCWWCSCCCSSPFFGGSGAGVPSPSRYGRRSTVALRPPLPTTSAAGAGCPEYRSPVPDTVVPNALWRKAAPFRGSGRGPGEKNGGDSTAGRAAPAVWKASDARCQPLFRPPRFFARNHARNPLHFAQSRGPWAVFRAPRPSWLLARRSPGTPIRGFRDPL